MDTQWPVSFKVILEHVAQEVIRADAEMQLLQRAGWQGLIQQVPLAKGLDELERLHLNEVKLKFWLEPARPGWWLRFKRWILGKQQPIPERAYRIASEKKVSCWFRQPIPKVMSSPPTEAVLWSKPTKKGKREAFEVTIAVSRSEDGKFIANYEVSDKPLEGVYVARFSL